jgi:hypothetical protein
MLPTIQTENRTVKRAAAAASFLRVDTLATGRLPLYSVADRAKTGHPRRAMGSNQKGREAVLKAVNPAGLRAGVLLLLLVVAACGAKSEAAVAVTALPDNRAYELVSPPDKNGGDVLAATARTRVATDGGAIAFASLTGFGDVAGTGIASDYLAVRSHDPHPGTSGWTTHAVTPPQDPLTSRANIAAMDPLYEGDFSPDLSRGIFRAWSLLGDAPNVSNVENLYLRTDLRSAGAGSYQLLSDAVAPVGSPFIASANRPFLAGTSADFEHVLFESRFSLTADAAGDGPWLYEWDHGTLQVAGVLPDGTPLSGALAGQGARQLRYTPHTISADGLKIFFTDPATGFNGTDGTLYLRKTDSATDSRSTVQLNASERTDCADQASCSGTPEPDPGGPQPATYWDASVDGGRVFFTTGEALTDDAPVDGDIKLYMYDTTKPDDDPHNLTLLSVDDEPADSHSLEGAIGASADGRYAYFIAAGQLVSGSPLLGTDRALYLWHDGNVIYIGTLNQQEDWAYDLPQNWNLTTSEARVTPDGRHLLFMSSSGEGLTELNQGNCPERPSGQCRDLYVYSADTGQLRCASCGQDSASANADAAINVATNTSGAVGTWSRNRAISDDGRYVFFSTVNALVPEDINGKSDAYEYDTATDRLHLLSSGKDPSDSYFMNASPSGNDAFILTRQRLVGWDIDEAYDLYDVRVGGGFPDPTPAPPNCEGDACQGASAPAPAIPAQAGTASADRGDLAAGNHKPASKRKPAHKRCRRGFVRKRVRGKVRCVRRRHVATKRPRAARKAR